MWPGAQTRLEIPSVALKRGRPLPFAHMGMHASCDLAQSFEACSICCRRLLSLLPGEEDDVTWAGEALMGHALNELPVFAWDRCRGNRCTRFPERDQPLEFGGNCLSRV